MAPLLGRLHTSFMVDNVKRAVKTLGVNLRRVRRQCGMSQEELADRVQTAQSMISLIERGKVITSFGKLVEIAEALDVGLGTLVEGCYEKRN